MDDGRFEFPRQEKTMNVSQANHPLQQNPAGETPHVSDSAGDEAFLNQLTMAQQGPEWFTETDIKTEKERVNEQQQARRRASEDLEDQLIVSLANQGHVNNLKQADAMESARVISDAENRERLAQHIEKKHLHTPTVVDEGDANKAEGSFSKLMDGEKEPSKGVSAKDMASIMSRADGDETGKLNRGQAAKPSASMNSDMMQRIDAAMLQAAKNAASGKTSAVKADKGLSELSKITGTDGVTGKTAAKSASARVMSMTGLSQISPESQKTATAQKTGAAAKTSTPVNIKDVVGTVKIMISSKTNEMVMKLAPEHLGKLEIRLKKDGDRMLGLFKVDSQQVKEAIEVQLPQLKADLAEQGIHIEEFSVLVNGDESSSQSFAFSQGRDGDANQTRQSDTIENEGNSGLQSSEPATGNNRNDSGLNIYA